MFGVIVDCDYSRANCESTSGYQQSSLSLAALAALAALAVLPSILRPSIRGLFDLGRKCPLYAYPARNRAMLRGRAPSERAPLWYRLSLRPYTCSAYPCLAEERRRQGAEGRHHERISAPETDMQPKRLRLEVRTKVSGERQ
jgi:hypothetical protein